MRRLVFATVILCLAAPVWAQTTPNYQCLVDCGQRTGNMSYCQAHCAFETQTAKAQAGSSLTTPPRADRGMKYECYAACKAQKLEDDYCTTACAD